jgi:hypothetical protein
VRESGDGRGRAQTLTGARFAVRGSSPQPRPADRLGRDNDYDRRRNEATTRLHLIDRLIEDCLAWPTEKIKAEDAYEGTYLDYLLAVNGTHLVVEAKREGAYFELPPGFQTRTLSLRALRETAGAVSTAIEQALTYCLQRGIPLRVVCNGNQVVGFIGSRQDGIPPAEGRAIVFTSLEDMRAAFDEFWRCFSPAGVESQYLYALLQRASHPPPPPKLSSTIFRYPGTNNRNQIQTELQILGELFLLDVAETPRWNKRSSRKLIVRAERCRSTHSLAVRSSRHGTTHSSPSSER